MDLKKPQMKETSMYMMLENNMIMTVFSSRSRRSSMSPDVTEETSYISICSTASESSYRGVGAIITT